MWKTTKINLMYFEVPELNIVLKIENHGGKFIAGVCSTRKFGYLFSREFETQVAAKEFLESVTLFDLIEGKYES